MRRPTLLAQNTEASVEQHSDALAVGPSVRVDLPRPQLPTVGRRGAATADRRPTRSAH